MSSPHSSSRETKIEGWLLLVLAIALIGGGLRLDLLVASDFVIDGDEGIVGLMAKHILEGASIPTFYYGQHYMGSLEPLLVAGLASIMGLSTITLKLVPLLCSVLLIVVVAHLGRRTGGERVGIGAALFMALGPSPLMVWSSKARGGFIEIVLIGALALLAVIHWGQSARRSNLWVGLVGLLLGLGWWVNNQIIYFIAPIGWWIIAVLWSEGAESRRTRCRAVLKAGFIGTLAFCLGSAPFWLYNFRHNFASFALFTPARNSETGDHLIGLVVDAFPILVGAERFWDAHALFAESSLVAAGIYGVIFGIVAVQRARQIIKVPLFRADVRVPLEIFLVTIVVCIATFSLSSFGWLYRAPRYLLPAYVPLAVVVGYVAAIGKPRMLSVAMCSGALVLSVLSNFPGGRWAVPGEPFVSGEDRVSRDHHELIAWLESREIAWVRTNYWIGYRLAFETLERVKFRVFQEPTQERIASYVDESRAYASEKLPLILVPDQAWRVEKALTLLGTQYKRTIRSDYVVLYDLEPASLNLHVVPSEAMKIVANYGHAASGAALDGDLATRWGSAHPQSPDMEVRVDLSPPRELAAVEIDSGQWHTDAARALSIWVTSEEGKLVRVASPADIAALRYYQPGETPLRVPFAPRVAKEIVLRQEGRDPVFDWSIAELRLYATEHVP